jgi:hypothetical protein
MKSPVRRISNLADVGFSFGGGCFYGHARTPLQNNIGKRLLELDGSMGRKLRSKDPEEANFGFFSEEAAGTGVDILFSEYGTVEWP